LVGVITIGVAFAVNYEIEAADKLVGRAITHDQSNTDGTAAIIAPRMRAVGNAMVEKIHENWQYLMYKMSADYQEIRF
jgi:hypothetical protein